MECHVPLTLLSSQWNSNSLTRTQTESTVGFTLVPFFGTFSEGRSKGSVWLGKRRRSDNQMQLLCLQWTNFEFCCCLRALWVFCCLSLMHEAGCLIETWQLHALVWTYTCVCVFVCLLTAADCCETHRERSLFPFQSEAQATSITTVREGRKKEQRGGREGSDRWRNDLNSEGIFMFKGWIHIKFH